MKNKISGEAAAPANAVQQSSNRAGRVTKYNCNRELPTQTVLEFLRAQLPQQYELAEIVGKWVWLDFPKASHRVATNTLYRLGFHWNQRRCLWQHPCGACAPYAAHPRDPAHQIRQLFRRRRAARLKGIMEHAKPFNREVKKPFQFADTKTDTNRILPDYEK